MGEGGRRASSAGGDVSFFLDKALEGRGANAKNVANAWKVYAGGQRGDRGERETTSSRPNDLGMRLKTKRRQRERGLTLLQGLLRIFSRRGGGGGFYGSI